MATYLRKWSTPAGESALVPLSFRELSEKFLKAKAAKSAGCARFYRFATNRFVEWTEAHNLRPEDFGPEQLEDFVADLRTAGKHPGHNSKPDWVGTPLKPSTVFGYARAVRSLLIFAAKRGHISAAPILDMPTMPRSRPTFLTDENIKTLMKACEPRDRALIAFMLDTALRRAELCSLVWGDLSWDGKLGRAHVAHGKGDRERMTYFTRPTWDLMQAANGHTHDPSESVWHLGHNGLRAALDRLGARVGIDLHPHMMRHTAARRMLMRGMPLPAVQACLGHSSIVLTADLYGRFSADMAAQAFSQAMG